MAARVPGYVLTMRERFPGTPVLPDSSGFDFHVKMFECALDRWP
jgi:hypothetical protein